MPHCSKNVTFQTYIPPPSCRQSDQEFLKSFESKIVTPRPKVKINRENLTSLRLDLLKIIASMEDLKGQEKEMMKRNPQLSDDEWKYAVESIETNKEVLYQFVTKITRSFMESKKKFYSRRISKRRRLLMRGDDYQDEKDILLEKREDLSLKIDESLQKIHETMAKAKQEEVSKQTADRVLKEVLRKKHDAKNNIAKLEALLKLKQARINTAKGKGQNVPEGDVEAFQTYIGNLKSLWLIKLSIYEADETHLRRQLKKWKDRNTINWMSTAERTMRDLAKWKKVMFGCKEFPQVDFKGNITEFIRIRSQWDRYIDDGPDSTPIPIGWVWTIKDD